MDTSDDNKLVRPKEGLCSLLQLAGATKDVLTMKEVMFYLGQYIIQKQLYDQKQQHIVHCSHDELGRVLGVDSFSVKEPRVLFTVLTKNLVAATSQEDSSQSLGEASSSSSQVEQTQVRQEAASCSTTPNRRRQRRRRRRSCRSNDTGPSHSIEEDKEEEASEEDEDGPKRRRSDSYSLTFDDSLSWCVIGGLAAAGDRQSSNSHSAGGRSEVTTAAAESDSDNFSVEFEVESVHSDDYGEDDASLSADDQVYEFTIVDTEDDDSFDEDTEITKADYWRCGKCDELNPPLPRNCLRCWMLRQDWLRDTSCPKALPRKPTNQSAVGDSAGSDAEDNEGVDVPDGKRTKSPDPQSQCYSDSASSATNSQDLLSISQPSSSSQEKLWTSDSQPTSSTESLEILPFSAADPPAPGHVPELERSVSAEWRLPDSCLDPCLICQSRPKNGCIVHGRTGHLISCYVCARKLKKRNKQCPVCRLPIEAVILTYVS
ncbi:E3 ubiquitin-protein ligase Mdm2 isoform X1 [Nerophis lumbriciformis]|uniref:E3 ubiquitin-protein ligase Mdm2 isoform X1 n=1 Tax=Nerophis lumbriciformis TaxID=546530 RepID=UPI002ADFAAE3|nr:E3 ubiquitin-protein ligase Mdm2-like isoform X1 [Nerophis lumbriciformis]XP_061839575.1 E3 ubiquitin-protein ligase Mdm2-like isoform X1 [Nerophis lumbriciformis]XP_061839577.1 E3 ubiquitin-protein ligase Mdm2-like isoform X1 [Nerophis lumbriciformis]